MIKLYFDIETIPDQRPDAFERYLDKVTPPGNYKKQETIDAWMLENAEAYALQDYCKTGLNGLHGEICSVSWALEDDKASSITRGIEVDNERDLLKTLWNDLHLQAQKYTNTGDWIKFCWIGHNVIDFDLRFLKQRSLVNGIKPRYTIPADARHGGDWVFDTMKEWAGWRGYVKQDELVEALGIEVPDMIAQEIDGSMVWDLFKAGEYGTIAEYNRLDVHKVREIHKRMVFA